MSLLRIPCGSCSGTGRLTCDGANNPVAHIWPCPDCDGGQARCAECDAPAVDAWIEGRDVTPLCAIHWAQFMEVSEA